MQDQKTHLATLDGLRGVAALAVMLFHFSYDWPSGPLLPRAYLAVDFFFALSGFVIARAYEDGLRGGTLPVAKFCWLRVQRLYPLIFLASLLAVADELPRMALHGTVQNPREVLHLLREFLFGILLIPNVITPEGQDFPLNAPSWSLFYEFAVNIAYAVLARWLTTSRILLLLAASGLYLLHLNLAHGKTDFGHFPSQYAAGTARVTFSFGLGILLHRLHKSGVFAAWPKIPGYWLAVALLLSFLAPAGPKTWGYDPACIFALFPLLIAAGGTDCLPRRAVPLCLWLGRLSYPAYLLHWPLIYRNRAFLFQGRHGLGLAAATALASLAVLLAAWAALVFYDEKLRAWMRRTSRHPRKRPALA